MYEDKKDDQTNEELSVNETAPAYLGARPRAALLDVEEEEAPPRFVLSSDKYTGGVPDEGKLTSDELVALVEEGFAEIEAGNYYTSEEVSEMFWQKYGIRI
jgi:hypothetical protein